MYQITQTDALSLCSFAKYSDRLTKLLKACCAAEWEAMEGQPKPSEKLTDNKTKGVDELENILIYPLVLPM